VILRDFAVISVVLRDFAAGKITVSIWLTPHRYEAHQFQN
jgi:hypothetical protein